MDLDKPIIYIETFSTNSNSKNVLGKVIHNYNLSDANEQFINWTNSLGNNSFKIVSFGYPCSITLTMYDASLSSTNKSSIACLLILGKLRSEITYNLNNDDFESIADIIPMVTKISNGDITHFSDQNMMIIFSKLMEKIGTKV
jgi:hypothetical protein